ncbi:MAG TPA: hypothetical protein VKB93_12375 [Thermoanaerobaculia bacterium]|nr:hypothetical protein [Thermoanaerobaculia bacterium]
MRSRTLTFASLLICLALSAAAQTAHPDLLSIADNSFLLEEAYNQGPGVVQHISVFERDHDTGAWAFTFTQEWPAPAMKHQLSYSLPIETDEGTRLGDVSLHYRYQLLGDGEADLAIAPRFTVILPTGEDSSAGVQVGVPISKVLAPRLIAHTNIGATLLEDDQNEISLGQSLIYAPRANFQVMLESLWSHPNEGDDSIVISPGVRWSYNFKSGLQIVPGVAVPFGDGSKAVLLYLSFEHPFRKQ